MFPHESPKTDNETEYSSLSPSVIQKLKTHPSYINIALEEAVRNNNLIKFKELLEYNKKNTTNYIILNLFSIFYLKIEEQRFDFAKVLADYGINIDTMTEAGVNLLHASCSFAKFETLKFLVENNANVNIRTNGGENCLHILERNDDLESIDYLLKNTSIDINGQDSDGNTALNSACKKGKIELVKILLAGNADIDSRNKKNLNALDSALAYKKYDIFKLLLSRVLSDSKPELIDFCERNYDNFAELIDTRDQRADNSFFNICLKSLNKSEDENLKNFMMLVAELIRKKTIPQTTKPINVLKKLHDRLKIKKSTEKYKLFKNLYETVISNYFDDLDENIKKREKKNLFTDLLESQDLEKKITFDNLIMIMINDNILDYANQEYKRNIKKNLKAFLKSLNSKFEKKSPDNKPKEFEIECLKRIKDCKDLFNDRELLAYPNLQVFFKSDTQKNLQVTEYITIADDERLKKYQKKASELKFDLSIQEERYQQLNRNLESKNDNLSKHKITSESISRTKTDIEDIKENIVVIESKISLIKKIIKDFEEQASKITSELYNSSNQIFQSVENSDLIIEKKDFDNFLTKFKFTKKNDSSIIFSCESVQISEENKIKIIEILSAFYLEESRKSEFNLEDFFKNFAQNLSVYLAQKFQLKIKDSRKIDQYFIQLSEIFTKETQNLTLSKPKTLETSKTSSQVSVKKSEEHEHSTSPKQDRLNTQESLQKKIKEAHLVDRSEEYQGFTISPNSSPRTQENYKSHEIVFLRNLFNANNSDEDILFRLSEDHILSEKENYLMLVSSGLDVNQEKYANTDRSQLKAMFHEKMNHLVSILLPEEKFYNSNIKTFKSYLYGFIAYRIGTDEGQEQFLKNLRTLMRNSFTKGEYEGTGHASKASLEDLKKINTVMDELFEINEFYNNEVMQIKNSDEKILGQKKQIPLHPLRTENFRQHAFSKFQESIKSEIKDEEYIEELFKYFNDYSNQEKYHGVHENLIKDKFENLKKQFLDSLRKSLEFASDESKRLEIIEKIELDRIMHANDQGKEYQEQANWDEEVSRVINNLADFFALESMESLKRLKEKFEKSDSEIFEDQKIRECFFNFLKSKNSYENSFEIVPSILEDRERNKLTIFKNYAKSQFNLLETEYKANEEAKSLKNSIARNLTGPQITRL